MVTSYTARFFQPLNMRVTDENNQSEKELTDTLNVHLEINKADSIIEFFQSQELIKPLLVNLNVLTPRIIIRMENSYN